VVWVQALALGTSVCRGPGKRRGGGERKRKKKLQGFRPHSRSTESKIQEGGWKSVFLPETIGHMNV